MSDPTPNHGLSRPDRGKKNWHIPLNENFTSIDSRLEIRDTEANRAEYTPVEGAKFLATDTGSVYVGDGTDWTIAGSISGSPGAVMAAPGEVQSVIDQYSGEDEWGTQPLRTVSLVSGATYETTETWRVKPGMRLECNGALIRPQGDFSALVLGRDATVREPRINVVDVDAYSSACIVMTGENGKLGTPNSARIEECHLYNNQTTGVGLRFLGANEPVSMQRASGIINNFDRGVEFRAEGSGSQNLDGWCNGNRFDGNINGARIPIYLHSVNGSPVSGNTVRGQVQCSDTTEWVVRQEDAPDETNLRGNTYFLHIWDEQSVSNGFESSSDRTPSRAPIWYIGSGQQEYNSMRSLSGKHSNEWILNRSTIGADRNAIFTGLGEAASRGAVDFSHPQIYQNNDSPYHPDS